MSDFLSEFWSRPLAAVVAGCELLLQRMQAGHRIDGVVSRIIHTLSRAPGPGG